MEIKLKVDLFPVALIMYATYLTWPGALIPWSSIVLKVCKNIDNKYKDVAPM